MHYIYILNTVVVLELENVEKKMKRKSNIIENYF